MTAFDYDRPSGRHVFGVTISILAAIIAALVAVNVVFALLLDAQDASQTASSSVQGATGVLGGEPVAPPPSASADTTPSDGASAVPDPAQPPTETAPATVAPPSPEPSATPPVEVKPPAPSNPPKPRALGVVVIDAGHQARANMELEPIGPGATQRKPKVAGGATGVATGKPESLINLQVALKLRDELKRRGVTVVMVRTTQDVNIPNSERAKLANRKKADLFIRLHCDGGGSSSQGLSTLVPGRNRWTGPIVASSGKAGRMVHRAVIRSTGARDRGVVPRSDLSGFNWSTRPTVLVEMGFLSNPAEDRRLATSSYQMKLAKGMADGIVQYLRQR